MREQELHAHLITLNIKWLCMAQLQGYCWISHPLSFPSFAVVFVQQHWSQLLCKTVWLHVVKHHPVRQSRDVGLCIHISRSGTLHDSVTSKVDKRAHFFADPMPCCQGTEREREREALARRLPLPLTKPLKWSYPQESLGSSESVFFGAVLHDLWMWERKLRW